MTSYFSFDNKCTLSGSYVYADDLRKMENKQYMLKFVILLLESTIKQIFNVSNYKKHGLTPYFSLGAFSPVLVHY